MVHKITYDSKETCSKTLVVSLQPKTIYVEDEHLTVLIKKLTRAKKAGKISTPLVELDYGS